MELDLTLALAAGLAATALFAGWRGARPYQPMKGPRLTPWRFIMVTASAFLMPVLVHLWQLLKD